MTKDLYPSCYPQDKRIKPFIGSPIFKKTKECVFCNGYGVRNCDIGDYNDVEVPCDYCGGSGIERE